MTKGKQKFDNCNCKMSSFTEEDRQKLQEINSSFKKLLQKVANLKNDFAIYKQKLTEAEIANERLRQQLSLSLYKTDALEQWSATCGPFSNFSWAAGYSVLHSLYGPHPSRTCIVVLNA